MALQNLAASSPIQKHPVRTTLQLFYTYSFEEGLASSLNEDVDAAVGEGAVSTQNEVPGSWVSIEEICNGEWSIGGGN
jgi:hypothetical protein